MIWNCKEKKIEYGKKVLIMGILNVTPDSFSDGGDHFSVNAAANHAVFMEKEGADMIDIGAQSTRPGYTLISPDEEWARLKDVLQALKGRIKAPVSVDTFYPEVAEKALQEGADIINDISGVLSAEMAEIVKKSGAGWIIMHNGPGSVDEVRQFFIRAASQCEKMGVEKSRICFDMGIGFGKGYKENLRLIANIRQYKPEGYPLLLGTSRKRVIGEGSRQSIPKERTYGNIAADTAAVFGGADIIRIHDVKNEKQGIYMAESLKGELFQTIEEE